MITRKGSKKVGILMDHIAHISALMVDSIDDVTEHAETLVIGNDDPDFRRVLERLRPGAGRGLRAHFQSDPGRVL